MGKLLFKFLYKDIYIYIWKLRYSDLPKGATLLHGRDELKS